jgi:tetratricopeptide (TPR) repeat protein
MELLEGQTLRDRLAASTSKAVPFDQWLDIAIQICDGLQAAHQKGIIHRDIKPANIFLTVAGQAKILDFGLAKWMAVGGKQLAAAPQIQAGEDSEGHGGSRATPDLSLDLSGLQPATDLHLSRTGSAMGTAGYMSPEQVRGEKLDARTDLFSFGLVLYEMFTGQRAFSGETAAVVQDAILNSSAIPVRELNSALPAELVSTIDKALEKDRDLRYQHVSEMRADLMRLNRETESGKSVAVLPAATPRATIGKVWVAAVVALFLVMAAGIWYWRAKTDTSRIDSIAGIPNAGGNSGSIVLADFSNTTGDAVFDDTLKTALSVSLRQSPFLNALSDGQVAKTLQQMTRPARTRLTPEVARELCQRAHSKAYIVGSIASLGSEYVLGLKAVNCQNGDVLAQEQVTAATKEKVLDTLGAEASKLRGELGESLATVQKFDVPLAEATTSSLEALQAYSLGRKARNEKGAAAALPYHQRAIELDPNFAMAYVEVGIDYDNLSQPGRASEYFTKAFRLREHADEREKLVISAYYYKDVTGELDKATQIYQEEIDNYPRGLAYANLGVVYAEQGKYEQAAEVTRQAVLLAPDQPGSYVNLANFTLALQHLDETRQIIHNAQARKMDNAVFHSALYALPFLVADFAGMAEQQRWFAGHPGYENWGLALASDTAAYGGHLTQAQELTKRAVDSAVREDSKENGAIWQALAAQREAAYGNTAEARQMAAEALKLAPASPDAESEAALAVALAGDTARAESLAQDLGKRIPLNTQMQGFWLPAIQGQVALNRKNPASALKALQPSSAIELGQIDFVLNLSCLYPVYMRGEAYLAAGQGSAAAAEFQKILDHSGIVWNCWTGALAHLGVARADALESRTAQGAEVDAARVRALEAYRDFFTLWKDADPSIHILREAKAEEAKLR